MTAEIIFWRKSKKIRDDMMRYSEKTVNTMKPILKYRGGKSKEIKNFEKFIPSQYDTYFEPFLGGGAVFFHLEPEKAVINDVNSWVINFYRQLQTEFQTVCAQLNELQEIYETNQLEFMHKKKKNPEKRVENKNESLYYEIREMFNRKITSKYLDSVLYFFINKTAYSGMIRYNASGEFNVPFGRYQHFNTKMITEEHHNLLKTTDIRQGDFSDIFRMAGENDFMFLDPPYDCVFNDYGNLSMVDGFNEEEHRRLAKEFETLKCKALMVIGKTPLTEELYKNFIKDEYFKSYAVNIRNRFKSESKHLVITNY